MKEIDQVSGDVLDLAIRIDKGLGPALLAKFADETLKKRFRRIVNDHRPLRASA